MLIFISQYGIGNPAPIDTLVSQFDGTLSLIWADGTNGTGFITADQIMDKVITGFEPFRLRNVEKVADPDDIPHRCPQNFNLFSECFAAVAFTSIPSQANSSESIAYTLRADGGLFHVDVVKHTGDFERRILPLQWAIDSAIIELTSGTQMPTPLEWPFTNATNTEQFRDIRLSYIRGLRTLLVLALFICYVGIAYQLPGAFATERSTLLTSHLKAMGLLDSARVMYVSCLAITTNFLLK